jgi:hypothetical protein
MRLWVLGAAVTALISSAVGMSGGATRSSRVGDHVGAVTQTQQPIPAMSTRTLVFQAFSPSGVPLLHVTKVRGGGSCEVSDASGRRDALRCTSGNALYDPCFSSVKRRRYVLCPNPEHLGHAVKIKLKQELRLRRHGRTYRSNPWMLQLADGNRCVLGTGANDRVNGLTSYWYCNKRHGRWIALWGQLHRNTEPWTARIGTVRKPSQHRARITVGWY